jgi:hypothetical protein
VDDAGAVHREARDHAALHQVDQDRIQSDFDGVGAHAYDHRAVRARGAHDVGDDGPQRARRQDVGQGVQEARETLAFAVGPAGVFDADLAGPRLRG